MPADQLNLALAFTKIKGELVYVKCSLDIFNRDIQIAEAEVLPSPLEVELHCEERISICPSRQLQLGEERAICVGPVLLHIQHGALHLANKL